jgi:hypothetical protein
LVGNKEGSSFFLMAKDRVAKFWTIASSVFLFETLSAPLEEF